MTKEIFNTLKIIGISFFICLTFSLSGSNSNINNYGYGQNKLQIDSIINKYSDFNLLLDDSVITYLHDALKVSINSNYEDEKCQIYYLIATYYSKRFKTDSSLNYYLKAWDIGIKINRDYYFKHLGHLIAENYWQVGDYYSGLNFSIKVKDYYENNNYSEKLYYIHDIIGLIYRELGDFNSALENFHRAHELAQKENKQGIAGVIYSNIGSLYLRHNEINKALNYYRLGVQIEEKYGYTAYAGRSYVSIAKIYLEKELPDTSLLYLNKALNNNYLANDNIGFARTYSVFGKTYIYYKDYRKAIEYLKKAEDYGRLCNNNVTLSEIYYDLSAAYDSIELVDSSYYYFKDYFSIYNNLFDVSKLSEVKRIEYDLQVEKNKSKLKQYEIEKQKTRNTLFSIIIFLSILASFLFISLYIQSIRSKRRLKIINKELLHARIKAEESDKLKSQFLKTISHEIRTPLNGIIGFSEMIVSEEIEKNELNEIQHHIYKNSFNLINTIENLVDMAHLNTNQYPLQISKFKILPLLQTIIKQAKEDLLIQYNKRIEILLDNVQDTEIESDQNALKKILNQLILNAIKFTDTGFVKIGFKRNNSEFILIVEDTGVGISKDKLNIIFNPFRIGDEQFSINPGGTGLGLAIVKNLTHILHGQIDIESETGKGTTFFIHIPVNQN